MPDLTAAAPSPPTLPPGLHLLNTVGLQALVDRQGALFGHELFNRSWGGGAHTAASDALAVFGTLGHAGPEPLLDGETPVFINCTYASLSGGHLELLPPRRTVLEIPPPSVHGSETLGTSLPALQELRQRGFRLAFSHEVLQDTRLAAALPLADFLKFDLGALETPQALAPLLAEARRRSPALQVAEKVETTAQWEALHGLGVDLFQGYAVGRPSTVPTRLLLPSPASLGSLLQQLQRQAPIEGLERVLRQDPALTFHLLRVLRTSGLADDGGTTSLREALARMGRKRLFCWAALLFTATRGAPPCHAAWRTASRVRASLMERLARHLPRPQAEQAEAAWLTGLLSLLDEPLQLPMATVLSLLALPPPVRAALQAPEGTLGRLLQLAQACDSADDTLFQASASRLGLESGAINLAHLQALADVDGEA